MGEMVQAVVFHLMNKRRGKGEVNVPVEAMDSTASKQTQFAMENVMGQDSVHCIHNALTQT